MSSTVIWVSEVGDRARRGRRFIRRVTYAVLVSVFVAVGVGTVALARVELPEAVPLAETSVVYARDGRPIAELRGGEDRFHVTLDDISPVLVDAVISTEDRDFRSHAGVDPLAIARALWADLRTQGSLQGGSTITQQYVKNVYLDADRTLERKVREAALAIRLEHDLDKDEILERYLNTIYFGRGAYGVEAAARAWYGPDATAADLDLARSAYLAGLIRAPETADAGRPEQVAEADRRRHTVLDAMVEQGHISAAERDGALTRPVTAGVVERQAASDVVIAPEARDAGVEWIIDEVRRQIAADHGGAAMLGRGLRITTTIDLDAQRQVAGLVAGRLGDAGPAGAVIVLDDLGGVRVHVGGQDRTRSEVDLALGLGGGGGGRQPGSAFKAFVLAAAAREGISLDSRYPDPPTVVIPGADDGADWVVSGSGGGSSSSDLVTATARSSNTVFAQLIDDVGPTEVAEVAAEMGVRAPLDAVHALALGAQEVSVLDMAAGYSVLSGRGVAHEPTWITEIATAGGQVLHRHAPEDRRVLSEQEADVVTVALEAVVRGGTGQRAAVDGVPVAGKTGTSQDNADAWFVGYTPGFTAAVWVGHPEGRVPMLDVLGVPAVNGSNVPAELFAAIVGVVAEPGVGSFVDPGRPLPGRVRGPDLADPSLATGPVMTETPTTGPVTTAAPTTETTTGGPGSGATEDVGTSTPPSDPPGGSPPSPTTAPATTAPPPAAPSSPSSSTVASNPVPSSSSALPAATPPPPGDRAAGGP